MSLAVSTSETLITEIRRFAGATGGTGTAEPGTFLGLHTSIVGLIFPALEGGGVGRT